MNRELLFIQAAREEIDDRVSAATSAGRATVRKVNVLSRTVDMAIVGGATLLRNVDVLGDMPLEDERVWWIRSQDGTYAVVGRSSSSTDRQTITGAYLAMHQFYSQQHLTVTHSFNYNPIVQVHANPGWGYAWGYNWGLGPYMVLPSNSYSVFLSGNTLMVHFSAPKTGVVLMVGQ